MVYPKKHDTCTVHRCALKIQYIQCFLFEKKIFFVVVLRTCQSFFIQNFPKFLPSHFFFAMSQQVLQKYLLYQMPQQMPLISYTQCPDKYPIKYCLYPMIQCPLYPMFQQVAYKIPLIPNNPVMQHNNTPYIQCTKGNLDITDTDRNRQILFL